MTPATEDAYRKLATHHYKMMSGDPYFSTVRDYMQTVIAPKCKPDYFRRLRNAIAFDQEDKGYEKNAKEINSLKYPKQANDKQASIKSKSKKKRVKHLSGKEKNKIRKIAHANEDYALTSLIAVLNLTGCRPIEVLGIKINKESQTIFINGAKKTENGIRGLDRELLYEDKSRFERVVKAITYCQRQINKDKNPDKSKVIDKIRKRFDYMVRNKVYRSDKKEFPCLYSYRHTFGSALKASDLNDYEVAYMMGHQSTASVSAYGDKRRGKKSGKRLKIGAKPAVSTEKIKTMVRDTKTNYSSIGQKKSIKVKGPSMGM